MYRSSKHKNKIKAALSNPINSELVIQLKQYLDEDDIIDSDEINDSSDNPSEESKHTKSDEKTVSTKSNYHHAPVGAPSKSLTDEYKDAEDLFDEDLDDSEEKPEDDNKIPEESTQKDDNSSEDIENGTQLNGDTIQSSTSISSMPEEIKGLINSRQDTCGVNRVLCKDCELWIYYEDKINLNTVMGPVIELINAANYTYLDFNRLARSDNAMVFQVNQLDSNSNMKTIGEISDESKK